MADRYSADITLLYQFAATQSLNAVDGKGPNLSLTRSGSVLGTYYDSSGVLQTAAANVARFGYDPDTLVCRGLVFEGHDTFNFVPESYDFEEAAWAWNEATHAASSETVPDGTTVGSKMIETDNTANFYVESASNINLTNNKYYTQSVHVKKGTRDWIRVEGVGTAAPANAFCYFNVSTGAIGTIGAGCLRESIIKGQNGWYRCTITWKADATSTGKVRFSAAAADNGGSYAGTVTNIALHLWGAQLEDNRVPSSFIYTDSVGIGRNKDVMVNTDVSWLLAKRGTTYFEVRSDNFGNTMDIFSIADTSDALPGLLWWQDGSVVRYRVNYSGGLLWNLNSSGWDDSVDAVNRVAACHAEQDYQMYCNGVASAHGASFNLTGNFNKMRFGDTLVTGNPFMGVIVEVRHYGFVRKSDQFLDDLSAGLHPEPRAYVPAVLSVEKFSLSMTGSSISTSALSKGQTIANCVPFLSYSSDDAGNDASQIDVVRNAGTNKFDLSCGVADGTRVVEVTVVEFDPDEVRTQEVSFTLGSGLSNTLSITDTEIPSTFPIIYYKTADTGSGFRGNILQARIFNKDSIWLNKQFHSSDLTGHVYILEALNGAWTIQRGEAWSYTGNDTDEIWSATLTPSVNLAETGLFVYRQTEEDNDYIINACWDHNLGTGGTKIHLDRSDGGVAGADSRSQMKSYMVEFDQSVAVVQQGFFDYDTATTKTAAISAPTTLGNTMILPTNMAGYMEGSGAGGSKVGAQSVMTFNSTTEVLGTRGATGVGNYTQKFQVIEWLIASAGGGGEPLIMFIG